MNFRTIIITILPVFFIYSCQVNNKKVNEQSPESYWKEQINLYPDSFLLKENLIQNYRDSGNILKAIQTTTLFLNTDTNNAKLWHIKGVLDFENDDTLQSSVSFRKAYLINPNAIDAIYLARILACNKNASCLDVCKEMIKKFGNNYKKDFYLIKGIYFSAIKEYDTALNLFDSSIQESYTYMDAYIQKATTLMSANKYIDAITVLSKATTVQNNFDDGYFYLGKCYEKINDNLAAIEAYKKTILINPDYTDAKEALSRLEK
jgi:tetratricopeptide (TPR) repeat protein